GRTRSLAQLIELVQTHVIGATFHVGCRERHAERLTQGRDVLEEDLLLKVFRAGGDEHALAFQDGWHQVRERLAGARAGFGQQHAATLEHPGDRRSHLELPGAGFEIRYGACERAAGRERGPDDVLVRGDRDGRGDGPRTIGRAPATLGGGPSKLGPYSSGYRGNFRHNVSTSARTIPSA